VHEFLGTHHRAAQRGADGLVAQAHAEDGQLAGKVLDRCDRDAGFGG